jgi:hypothetical protein
MEKITILLTPREGARCLAQVRHPSSVVASDIACTSRHADAKIPPTGNSSQICGGSAAINIYVRNNFQFTNGMDPKVHTGIGKYSFTQCWQ